MSTSSGEMAIKIAYREHFDGLGRSVRWFAAALSRSDVARSFRFSQSHLGNHR